MRKPQPPTGRPPQTPGPSVHWPGVSTCAAPQSTMGPMRNGEWEGFQRGRNEARSGLTALVARYYAGHTDPATVAMIAGALKIMTALTYSRGATDDLERSLEPAHHYNRLRKVPCGCQTRVRCTLPGVDPDRLFRDLHDLDHAADLDLHISLHEYGYDDEDGYDDEEYDEDEDEGDPVWSFDPRTVQPLLDDSRPWQPGRWPPPPAPTAPPT